MRRSLLLQSRLVYMYVFVSSSSLSLTPTINDDDAIPAHTVRSTVANQPTCTRPSSAVLSPRVVSSEGARESRGHPMDEPPPRFLGARRRRGRHGEAAPAFALVPLPADASLRLDRRQTERLFRFRSFGRHLLSLPNGKHDRFSSTEKRDRPRRRLSSAVICTSPRTSMSPVDQLRMEVRRCMG